MEMSHSTLSGINRDVGRRGMTGMDMRELEIRPIQVAEAPGGKFQVAEAPDVRSPRRISGRRGAGFQVADAPGVTFQVAEAPDLRSPRRRISGSRGAGRYI